MVTANSAAAVQLAQSLVKDHGIVYLFSGFNALDQAATDADHVVTFESLHRRARAILTSVYTESGEKVVLMLGTSGYYDHLMEAAMLTVAENALELDKAVTGVISGWDSPRLESRWPNSHDWTTHDNSPVIGHILMGADLREQHLKVLILADECSDRSS